jgi:hypothetical protein
MRGQTRESWRDFVARQPTLKCEKKKALQNIQRFSNVGHTKIFMYRVYTEVSGYFYSEASYCEMTVDQGVS